MKNIDVGNIYYKHNPSYFSELFQLYMQTNGRNLAIRLNHSKTHLKGWIESELPILKDDCYTLTTKCYWILNGLVDFPCCANCGKPDNYKHKNVSLNAGYAKTCSVECGRMQQRISISAKLKSKSKDEIQRIVEKRKATCIEKYGVENPTQCKKIQQKSRSTRLKKNNGKYFDDQSISKMLHTKHSKYGSANNYQKIKQTCLEKYGVENIGQLDKTKDKVKQTCMQKYGVDCILKSAVVKKKIAATCLKKYGADNIFKLKRIHDKAVSVTKAMSYNEIILKCEFDSPMFTLEEYIARQSDKELLQFKCKKCGREFYARHENGHHKHCEYCYPTMMQQLTSNEEKSLVRFIQDECKQADLLKNTKRIIAPYEIDVCIPTKHIAFEFDGLYWHDDNKKTPNYHLAKTKACEEKGYQLIHIFENEWIYKQSIVKSRIKSLLGIYDNVVFARKCEVRDVTSKESKIFQEANHIQGAVNAKVHLGLYCNNELISLMTFGKCRFDKKHEWELLRFCNKLGYHIPGAASRLLKHFERNWHPKSLVSYADRRWSQGKLYEALGFKLDHMSAPNYWYWKDGKKLESRIKYQKHKLKNIFENFDNSLSEYELMNLNGYHKIYDCGNLCFVKYYY